MIHTKVHGADFCDDQFPIISPIGRGPKGEKGDPPTDEQTYAAISRFVEEHPEYVTTVEDGTITHPKMANDSVGQDNIIALSVGTSEIADGAITTPKIDDDAVTTPKIEDYAITTSKIADGSVTYEKIDGSTLPTMSTSSRGIAKVGAGLAMNGDALELDGSGDIATAVTAWLNAHPEATTTVQDGSIILSKLGFHIEYVITNNNLTIQLVDNQENH